jgi:hypothetical protein
MYAKVRAKAIPERKRLRRNPNFQSCSMCRGANQRIPVRIEKILAFFKKIFQAKEEWYSFVADALKYQIIAQDAPTARADPAAPA